MSLTRKPTINYSYTPFCTNHQRDGRRKGTPPDPRPWLGCRQRPGVESAESRPPRVSAAAEPSPVPRLSNRQTKCSYSYILLAHVQYNYTLMHVIVLSSSL